MSSVSFRLKSVPPQYILPCEERVLLMWHLVGTLFLDIFITETMSLLRDRTLSVICALKI